MEPRSPQEQYTLSAKLSAVNGAVLTWKENSMKESVEEIVDYLIDIIRSF